MDTVDEISNWKEPELDGEVAGAATATDVVAANSRDAKINFMAFFPQWQW